MKLKPLVIFSMIGLLSISGCMKATSENKQAEHHYYSYIDEIPKNKILSGAIMIEYDGKDTPEYLRNKADYIVKATVQSIDDADMKYSIIGCTYGTISIDEVYYGDKISGILPFVKEGGIIKMEDWENAQPKEAQNKHRYLREQSQNDEEYPYTYFDTITEENIYLEAGKTYLMYLTYHEEIDKYEILGLKNGAREIIEDKNTAKSFLINDTTGEHEDLSEYLKQYVYE